MKALSLENLLVMTALSCLLEACPAASDSPDTSAPDSEADADADADTDTDADADADSDADGDLYTGFEYFEYGWGYGEGYRDCALTWEANGTPVAATCNNCLWVFDVAMTLDRKTSFDNGTCTKLATDTVWTYAYTTDYRGYGAYLLEGDHFGHYYAFAKANFQQATGELFYHTPQKIDVPDDRNGAYPGYYYTYYIHGEAFVK
jgi:hypothetical protein